MEVSVARLLVGAAALGPLVAAACSGAGAARAGAAPRSVYTALDAASCRRGADADDPNATPYLLCPGVGGYALIVRHVDAGRESIDVVGPGRRVFPLNYQDVVTRHMSTLGGTAEWRVATDGGVPVPIALVVRVRARGDAADPEKVTASYAAVAKVAPDQACVTDVVAEGTRPPADVRAAADSARRRRCAPPQPHVTADGAVVR